MTSFFTRMALAIVLFLARLAGATSLFEEGFDSPDALSKWQPAQSAHIRIEGTRDSQALRVEAPAGVTNHAGTRITLPLDALRGTRVRVEAMVKAEGVTEPPKPWNGIKVMLHSQSPDGEKWEQQNNVHGSFDWKRVGFTARVPTEATAAWLVLGLEAVNGVAWFDDVKVTVTARARTRPAQPATGAVFKGHDLPRLRGAMISPKVTADDLQVLGGEWGANHVRWQLLWGGFPHSPADKGDLAAYDAWLESALKHLDELLPVCERLGIKVVIDLHTPPGGRNDAKECRLFHEKRFQDSFIAWWEKMAARYRGNKAVWGYDLVNEPVEGFVGDGLMDWHTLADATARRVRAIDSEHAIIIEPAPWGGPSALEDFEPLEVPGIVYSVHMYEPGQFTHQGVYDRETGVTYPGDIAGSHWDKERLRRALRPAIEFQRDYGAHIYIGEFSAIRWAPGDSAERYLRDVIDIFEEQGWDWAYHAFREWHGWSVEHGGDKANTARSSEPTTREKLLREYFAKNRKPVAVTPNEFEGSDTERINRAIEAAAASGGRVVIPRVNVRGAERSEVWLLDSAILLRGNVTVVLDDCRIKLSDRCRDNFMRSANCGAGITGIQPLRNIHLRGTGRAVLEGADRPRATGDGAKTLGKQTYGTDAGVAGESQSGDWRNLGILLAYVDGFSIENIAMRDSHCWAISLERCSNGVLRNLDFASGGTKTIDGVSRAILNQDGIDLRLGCHDIAIENITGFTGDDLVALTGIASGRAPGALDSTMVSGSIDRGGGLDDIHHVTMRGINGYCSGGHHIVRLLNTLGIKMHDILIDGLEDKSPAGVSDRAALKIGDKNPRWGGITPLGDTSRITVRNITSRAQHAILVAGSLTDSTIDNVVHRGAAPEPVTVESGPENLRNVTITNARKEP
ncbi:MAG: cellulase family glycosylhydrolase [Verrucomicrobiaceae bacterium]|nr:cellulase family glycosylhydrolase [Verrucomicrobiaceae bacterium]